MGDNEADNGVQMRLLKDNVCDNGVKNGGCNGLIMD